MSRSTGPFRRPYGAERARRLAEPRRFIQVVAGARQVGTTTLAGLLVESAVGAQLANAAALGACEVFWWRDRNREVDFVVRAGKHLAAVEVKSARRRDTLPGVAAFAQGHRSARSLLVGGDGIAFDEFLARPVACWLGG